MHSVTHAPGPDGRPPAHPPAARPRAGRRWTPAPPPATSYAGTPPRPRPGPPWPRPRSPRTATRSPSTPTPGSATTARWTCCAATAGRATGPVPWEHEPNRGFLTCLGLLALAAKAIGETDEYERCRRLPARLEPGGVRRPVRGRRVATRPSGISGRLDALFQGRRGAARAPGAEVVMSTKSRPGRLLALPGLLGVLAALLLVPGEASAAPPVANSGPSATVVAGTDAQLSGSVSDPDGDDLEIHWMATVVDGGDLTSCAFSGPWSWEPVSPEGLSPDAQLHRARQVPPPARRWATAPPPTTTSVR